MAIQIPITRGTDDTSFFELKASLDGTTYTLVFRWNVRGEFWSMAVYDVNAERLISSTRLVADWGLNPHMADREPTGFFLLRDTSKPLGSGDEPGFDDLGNRHILLYFSLSELGQ